jgi:hypothetical protein
MRGREEPFCVSLGGDISLRGPGRTACMRLRRCGRFPCLPPDLRAAGQPGRPDWLLA